MKIIRISALWCSSCIVTYKDWNLLREKYPENEYIEYDYDMDADIVSTYQVGTTIPVLIAFENDKEIGRIIGEKKIKELISWIEGMNSV